MDIIQYLLSVIQYLYQQNCWLINFICKYIPLRQWAFDDSHSPKYQKLKTDELPRIGYRQDEWDWQILIPYFEHKYHKKELQKLTAEFGKIGSNLNQIARYFHMGGIRSKTMQDEIHECISQIFAMRKEIAEMAGTYHGSIKMHC